MRRSVALLALLLCGCGSSCDGESKGPAAVASASPELVGSAPINLFAWELYEDRRPGGKNLVLAPGVVASTMGLIHAGAKGATAGQLATVLRLGTGPDAEKEARARFAAVSGGTDVSLRHAVRFWIDDGVELADRYKKETEGDGAFALLGFAKDGETSRRAINAWSAQRLGKTEELAWAGAVDSGTRIVATIGASFRPRWQYPFDPSKTSHLPFEFQLNREGLALTMTQKKTFLYGEFDWGQLLEMPCVGGGVVVDFLLPKRDKPLVTLEKAMTSGGLATWLKEARTREVEVFLPKFSIRTQELLGGTLARMGMADAFGPEADFTNLSSTTGISLSEVIHDVFMDVAEGAASERAAAVPSEAVPSPGGSSTSSPAASALPPASGVRFAASRPFAFVVRDTRSGAILFIGRFARP